MKLNGEGKATVCSEIFSPLIREQKFVRGDHRFSWNIKRRGNKGALPAFINYTRVSNLHLFTG